MAATTWVLITGEYPPQPGGVADYSRLVARGLARAGDAVHVFTGPWAGPTPADPGVAVQRLPGGFAPVGLADLSRRLSRLPRPRRLLVQYVPHAYGWKGMNLPFCLWLAWHRQDPLWVMFHEVAFPVRRGQPWRHNLLGGVNRLMAALLAWAARRVFVSIPGWEPLLRKLAPRLACCTWLPVPSNLDARPSTEAVARQRRLLAPGATQVLGHFGTYGDHIVPLLRAVLPPLLTASPQRVALLLGRGGDGFARALVQEHPGLAAQLVAPGAQPAEELSERLAACDLLLQPYPDGASSRRTSLMAGLALGRPIVTTEGALTEPLWRDSSAVALAPAGDTGAFVEQVEQILSRPDRASALAAAARDLYQSTFSLERTVAGLRSPCEGN
jgi:glycosyltransferase involved in cell wall biosynthesis